MLKLIKKIKIKNIEGEGVYQRLTGGVGYVKQPTLRMTNEEHLRFSYTAFTYKKCISNVYQIIFIKTSNEFKIH